MQVPTIKVKPSSPEQGDHVLINEADFDPAVHERLEDAPKPKKAKAAEGEAE